MASGHASAESGARAALPARIVSELREILGPDAVLDRYEDLLVYEYDAYMDRSLPQVVVRPTSGEQVAAVVRLAARERLAVTATRRRQRPQRRRHPGRGRHHDRPQPDAPHPRSRRRERAGAGRAGPDQPGPLDGRGAARALLRAGPVQPEDQHHRRQHRRERWRAALPLARHDHQPRRRAGVVTRDGLLCTPGGPAPDAPGYDLVGLAVGSEGTFGDRDAGLGPAADAAARDRDVPGRLRHRSRRPARPSRRWSPTASRRPPWS